MFPCSLDWEPRPDRMLVTCSGQFGMYWTADLSHACDEMEPFLDSEDKQVAGQTIVLAMLKIGAELEIPVEMARGDLLLMSGLRFVAPHATEGAFSGQDGNAGARSRSRTDFVIDYRLDGGVVLGFDRFYSGLGRRELVSYGAGIDLRLELWCDRGLRDPPRNEKLDRPSR